MAPSDSRSVNRYGHGPLVCKFPINVTVPSGGLDPNLFGSWFEWRELGDLARGGPEGTMRNLKSEAAYFIAEGGYRTAMIFFDMQNVSDIPGIVEPLFMGFNAEVELLPVMNADDLKKGLTGMKGRGEGGGGGGGAPWRKTHRHY